jgi:uncharacterized membrane protein YagU involved in acid resistance
MEFNVLAGMLAGFIGTLVMTGTIMLSKKAGMTNMPAMPLISGSMMSDDRSTATMIGAVIHFIVMGTIVFGIGYAALFALFGTASWLAGLIIGIVHGAVVGGVFMPMMDRTHPRMTAASAFAGDTTVAERDGHLRLAAPGMFGKNWGGNTPMGIIMGHAIFGLVVALVYSALV